MTIFCDRSHRPTGWSNLGTDSLNEWWVDAVCGKPTKEWLLGSGNTVLNYFRGGPMDGQAHETTTLLSTSALEMPTGEYRWTPEIITSSITGQKARVWIHMTPDELASMKGNKKMSKSSDKAAAANLPPVPPTDTNANPADKPAAAADTAPKAPKVPSTAVASVKGETITSRRKALKFGREDLAARAGISVSQLWRFENDKPVKAGTEEKTVKALEAAEAEKAKDDEAKAAAEASAAAQATATENAPADAEAAVANPA